MKLTEHVYMTSGVPYGTNSNTYAIRAGEGVILIDSGYSAYQWGKMSRVQADWGLSELPLTHLLLTHVHFDHAGNAHLARDHGAAICVSAADGQSLRLGNENTLKDLTMAFPDPFVPCEPDRILKPGDILDFDGLRIEVIEGRGHSAGALIFLAHVDGKRILFTGDCITVGPDDAKDNILVDLAWCGGPDADVEEYGKTLRRMAELDADLLAPGHYHPYYGDTRPLFSQAIRLFVERYHT